jgi:Domain of unknown function (DUF397)
MLHYHVHMKVTMDDGMPTHSDPADTSLRWVKSSFSYSLGNCVEVASFPSGGVGVRDSRDRTGPALRFTCAGWSAFLRSVRSAV